MLLFSSITIEHARLEVKIDLTRCKPSVSCRISDPVEMRTHPERAQLSKFIFKTTLNTARNVFNNEQQRQGFVFMQELLYRNRFAFDGLTC